MIHEQLVCDVAYPMVCLSNSLRAEYVIVKAVVQYLQHLLCYATLSGLIIDGKDGKFKIYPRQQL